MASIRDTNNGSDKCSDSSDWALLLTQEPLLREIASAFRNRHQNYSLCKIVFVARRFRACAPTIVSESVSWSPSSIEEVNAVIGKYGRLWSLNLCFIRPLLVNDWSTFHSVRKVTFYQCNDVSDVSAFASVLGRNKKSLLHSLDLGWCSRVEDVSPLGALSRPAANSAQIYRDANIGVCCSNDAVRRTFEQNLNCSVGGSFVSSFHTLRLNGCYNVKNVGALGFLHSLDLSWCSGVVDVSAIGRVHTLNLAFCTQVEDVSALGGVHTLNLSHCEEIVDVRSLAHVHSLNLTRCIAITNVDALGSVHTLNLTWCTGVTDVSALAHVHTLNLARCSGVSDVRPAFGVHTLTFDGAWELSSSLSALKDVHTLNVLYPKHN